MKQPYFSIIVPVYKVKKEYLDQCVTSLTDQTYRDIEIILVDDGSPDDCGKYCDEYAANDERIRVIHQANGGVSSARNHGIHHVRGEWILFVDSDDWLEPNACEVIFNYTQNTDSDIVEYGTYKNYADRELAMKRDIGKKSQYCADDPEDKLYLYRKTIQPPKFTKNALATSTTYYIWNKAFRTNFILEKQIEFPVGVPLSEDKVFFMRCLLRFQKISYVQDILYHYRQNSASASHKYLENSDKDRLKLIGILHELVDQMIQELSSVIPEAAKQLKKDLNDFIIMISSAVIFKKFYHKDWPYANRMRKPQAKAFLNDPLIKEAFDHAQLKTYTPKNVLRIWLLKHHLFGISKWLLKIENQVRRKTTQS